MSSLRLIKEIEPGLSVNANAIGTPQIYPGFFDMSDPDDARRYGKFVEVFLRWAGLDGGDLTSNIIVRAKEFSRGNGFPASLSSVSALEWANGRSLYNIALNGAGETDGRIITGDGTTNFITAYPDGEASAMFGPAPGAACNFPLMGLIACQVVRTAGGLITAGTVTLSKIRVYDD